MLSEDTGLDLHPDFLPRNDIHQFFATFLLYDIPEFFQFFTLQDIPVFYLFFTLRYPEKNLAQKKIVKKMQLTANLQVNRILKNLL